MSMFRDRYIDTLLLGISLGIGYSVLESLGTFTLAAALSPYYDRSDWWHDVYGRTPEVVGRGVMLGILWSACLWLTVSSKQLIEVAKWMLIVLLPFALLLQVFRGIWIPHTSIPQEWFTAKYIPSLLFLVLCAILSRFLNDETKASACSRCGRPFDPVCSKCGYNLEGNESGTCSECGTPTKV